MNVGDLVRFKTWADSDRELGIILRVYPTDPPGLSHADVHWLDGDVEAWRLEQLEKL